MQDVLRLESILRGAGLGDERLLLRIDVCAEHEETAWGRRFPGALRFLYGSAEGGRVVGRIGPP